MPIFSWIRDLFGIQLDMYKTKKTRLEIEQIEEEKRPGRITLATREEVERYDPKVEAIRRKDMALRKQYEERQKDARSKAARSGGGCLVSSLIVLLLTLIFLLLA